MQRLSYILVVLGTPLLLAARTDDDPRNELKALRGKWKTVAGEAAGMPFPKYAIPPFTVVIAADGKATGQTPEGEFLRSTFRGHSGEVRCVAISPDGKTIASGGGGNTLRFWDVASGKEQATLKAATYGIESVAFSPDGKTLAMGGGGNIIKLWDVATRESTTLLGKVRQYASPLVVFSPDGRTLASGGMCIADITLWDPTTRKQTAKIKTGDDYGIRALAFMPDGKTLASMGAHDGLRLWEVTTGKQAPERPPPAAAAKLIPQLGSADFRSRQQASVELKKLGIPVLPALRKAATLENELEVQRRLELLITQIEDATLTCEMSCNIAAFDPGGRTLATPNRDNGVKLWDTVSGHERVSLKMAADAMCLAFSPDGKKLAVGSEDGTIQLWEAANGKEIALKAHTDKVLYLAYSADGRMLASGSADKTIKLWDVAKTP
jgi:WD40 repeat protein